MTLEPQWYKDAVIYEVHVRAFFDSEGEGGGTFRGLTQKLDYLHDLGVTSIWLLPFYPSPLKDDGYDIADYTQVHAHYGTLDAFQEFLDAAHARKLQVITELVLNHTSDQHPWFQRARHAAPGTPERDFYVWSDSPDRFPEARIIFKDFETSNWTWDGVAKAYYWHRFYSHQPDLNFDNPAVWNALLPVVDFWFERGVDGLRLDAVPYLYERPGTNCENLPETHSFLKALREHIDERFPGRMLLAEANQWPEDAVAYFGTGDECHMAFHFPLMPRLFMAIHREDRLPVIDIMEQTPAIPGNCQWALFLRNHDELTLEMVTDEERDYMYEHYAADPRARINLGIRHRLAPLLGNDRRRIELMNGLLFSLPGTPVLYYGDEIGMGDNIYLGDRNGVRTPMQWTDDRNAGFSRANPQQLYLPVVIDPLYHYESVNVETQQRNTHSLLWWTKRLIGLRRRHPAFGRGSLEFLRPTNRRVLAFVRRWQDESILVLANLSRFTQHAELDLSAHAGMTPVEMFGGTHFPVIADRPYPVMLGPHSFHWFELIAPHGAATADAAAADLPVIQTEPGWKPRMGSEATVAIEEALLEYLNRSSRLERTRIRRIRISDIVPLFSESTDAHLLIYEATGADGGVTTNWVPVAMTAETSAPAPIARLEGGTARWLADASGNADLNRSLIEIVCSHRQVPSLKQALLSGVAAREGCPRPADVTGAAPVHCVIEEDGRPHAILDELCVLSYRSTPTIESRPEAELGRWLSESGRFPQTPRWLGSVHYQRRRENVSVMADLHAFVAHEGNAWQFTLEELSATFERLLASPAIDDSSNPHSSEREMTAADRSVTLTAIATPYLDAVRRMTLRLFELHQLTSAAVQDPGFAPEPFTTQYQRSWYQSLRTLASEARDGLQQAARAGPADAEHRARAEAILARGRDLQARLQEVLERRMTAWRIRVHGNFHLGQLLRCGADYMLTGFDGHGHSAAERHSKRAALHDLSGLLHSVDFASRCALYGVGDRHGSPVGVVRATDRQQLWNWAHEWRGLVFRMIIETYRAATADHPRLESADVDFQSLMRGLQLEHALREIRRQWPGGGLALAGAMDVLLEQLPDVSV